MNKLYCLDPEEIAVFEELEVLQKEFLNCACLYELRHVTSFEN